EIMSVLNADFGINLWHVPVLVLCLELLICDNCLRQVHTDSSDKRRTARLESHLFLPCSLLGDCPILRRYAFNSVSHGFEASDFSSAQLNSIAFIQKGHNRQPDQRGPLGHITYLRVD